MADNPQPPTPITTPAEVKIHRQRVGFLGWRPDKPDLRDWSYEITRHAGAAELPVRAFLPGASKLLPPIRNQGDQSSCTGHGTRSALQYKRMHEKQPPQELSPRFIYYNGRLIEDTTSQDAGAEIRDVIKGVSKLGATTEDLCPYSEKIFVQRPSVRAYKEAMQDVLTNYKRIDAKSGDASYRKPAIKQAINGACPVVFGFTVYENFMSQDLADTGFMDMPAGSVDGGHCVWSCGYDDTIKIRDDTGGVFCGNSWGNDWGCAGPNGERGYFWMPWSLICDRNFSDDFWALNAVS
jgi:C1A family cysteine protease